MARVLSGIQPSGGMHIGNYLGALRQWVADQDEHDAFYCIVDLHALTLEISPDELRARSLETAIILLAAGLDPSRCTLFFQSSVPQHAELAWILECIASVGELGRMTQFKEKAEQQESARVGLFTYPVLMAADILLYDAERVPVGDDQRQHLELTRDLAERFNARYGETFVVPEAIVPKVGARVMDLQNPQNKMSKSTSPPSGLLGILDAPSDIERKVRRAVTDTDDEVRYDPARKPGVSNLLELLSAAEKTSPEILAERYATYGALKTDTAEALVELLRPIRERAEELGKDPSAVMAALDLGTNKAGRVAMRTYTRARSAVGLVPLRELQGRKESP